MKKNTQTKKAVSKKASVKKKQPTKKTAQKKATPVKNAQTENIQEVTESTVTVPSFLPLTKDLEVKLSSLKPNKDNPRTLSKESFTRLQESIKRDPEFMVIRPLVIDSDLTILGGNQRYRAMKALKMSAIPADWVKDGSRLTAEQKKRFVLVDNAPQGMAGQWDYEVLANHWDIEELSALGFDDSMFSDFGGDEDDQGKLDQIEPKYLTCPHCGKEFNPKDY